MAGDGARVGYSPVMSSGQDQLLRTLSEDGGVTVRALEATELVADAARRHETGPLATLALGRALLGAILLGAGGKDDETLQLRFRGQGPLGTLLAIADASGGVRGYVSHPDADAKSVAQGVGLGDLSVVRHRPGWRQPYTGIVPIVSGEIAEDLALYLTESEQIPSAVALGVSLDEKGQVLAAAGYLAQALPEAEEETLDRLEFNVRSLPSPTELITQGLGAGGIADRLLKELGGKELESSTPSFRCDCDRERVVRAVALLGEEEVEQLRRDDEQVEVKCEFCAERYVIDPHEVRELMQSA